MPTFKLVWINPATLPPKASGEPLPPVYEVAAPDDPDLLTLEDAERCGLSSVRHRGHFEAF